MNLSEDDKLLQIDVRILHIDTKLMLLSRSSLKEILDQILKWVEDHSVNTIYTSILLYNKDTEQLFNGSSAALPDEYNRAINGIKAEASAGSCGTAAFHKKQVIVDDITTNPLWDNYRTYALKAGFYACWSTPVLGKNDELLGTFAIYYPTPRQPSKHDLKLVNEIAGIAAMAIEARAADFNEIIRA